MGAGLNIEFRLWVEKSEITLFLYFSDNISQTHQSDLGVLTD